MPYHTPHTTLDQAIAASPYLVVGKAPRYHDVTVCMTNPDGTVTHFTTIDYYDVADFHVTVADIEAAVAKYSAKHPEALPFTNWGIATSLNDVYNEEDEDEGVEGNVQVADDREYEHEDKIHPTIFGSRRFDDDKGD